MTTSRKIVVVLCAVFLGYGGFLTVEERSATSRFEKVREALAVGDTTERVERVMKDKGLEPSYSPKDQCYIAIIRLHQKRDVIMQIYLDSRGKVARIDIRTRMWM